MNRNVCFRYEGRSDGKVTAYRAETPGSIPGTIAFFVF